MKIEKEELKEILLKLREKSGSGLMKCKEAWEHSKGDFEKALEYLRTHNWLVY